MSSTEYTVKAPWFPLLAFVVFAACILAAGFAYYQIQVLDIRRENRNILSAIAELKIMQIVKWRQENIQDVQLLAGDPHLNENVHNALSTQDEGKLRAEILSLLHITRQIHGYHNITIFDTKGARLFTSFEQDMVPPDQATVDRVLNERRPAMGDLVRDAASGDIHLSIVAPLTGSPATGPAPAGVLAVCIDPRDYLFPLIQSWPTASQSAETLLVRREGEEVVYLNELRHRKKTACVFRRSVHEKDLPAASALRGEMAIHKGVDYRGEAVINAAKKVPDTPWLMIAKIDDAEILSPLRRIVLIAGCIFGLMMIAVGIFLYRHLELRRILDLRREQALDTLRESEERYRTVADFTFDWEFWLSPEKKYLYVSPSFERITGYPAQALLEDEGFLEKIVHPDDIPLIIPHMKAHEHTHGVPIDFRIITRAGEERWISHECQPVYSADGRSLGQRGSNRDITEVKHLRDEAIREAHLASIGRLAASVAHEINNPISGVINYAHLIRIKCSLPEKYGQYLDELIAESERVATIVKDLLMIARPHQGAPVPSDLRDLFDRTFTLFAKQFDRNAVKVATRFPEDIPPVSVRPEQIQQVILNIFTNALYALNKKFPGEDPGKLLDIYAEKIHAGDGAFVRLTFHDHGIGIPADMIARVCDPFFSTKPPGEGTGLGLSISRTIMKDHGGMLRIASNEGEYTKIMLEFPAMEERK